MLRLRQATAGAETEDQFFDEGFIVLICYALGRLKASLGQTGETMTAQPSIQYISSEDGDPTAVIVPIELWREISSERETAHLLGSETMRKRLLEARSRTAGIPFEEAREKLGV